MIMKSPFCFQANISLMFIRLVPGICLPSCVQFRVLCFLGILVFLFGSESGICAFELAVLFGLDCHVIIFHDQVYG